MEPLKFEFKRKRTSEGSSKRWKGPSKGWYSRALKGGIKSKAKSAVAVHNFVRTYRLGNSLLGPFWRATSTAEFIAVEVSISLLPNYTEFLTLFDEYRLTYVKVTVMPAGTQAENIGVTGNREVSRLGSAEDRTDSAAVTMDALMNYGTFRSQLLDKARSRTYKAPCVAMQAYQTLTATGYVSKKSPWIQSTDSQVPHYCGKMLILNNLTSVAAPYDYEIYVEVGVDCRQSR